MTLSVDMHQQIDRSFDSQNDPLIHHYWKAHFHDKIKPEQSFKYKSFGIHKSYKIL